MARWARLWRADSIPAGDQVAWQVLEYLNLYRCFVAVLFAGLFFTPIMSEAMSGADLRWARSVTAAYLVFAPVQLLLGRYRRRAFRLHGIAGLVFDIVGIVLMLRFLGGLGSGVGTLLVGTMGAAGAMLTLRFALTAAAAASMALLWQTVLDVFHGLESMAVLAPAGMLGGAYFATSLLGHYLARRTRESHTLAQRQSIDLAHLSRLNELIVARMRTGILIVDQNDQTHVMNDAAWYLMGMPPQRAGELARLSPDLLEGLSHWRTTGRHQNQPLRLAHGVPEVVPRFARLSADELSETLIFLEDTSMVSRRAQELTLASLGRLSATIAHEIRNPLAAISHSAQLLAESESLSSADLRLSQIINRHCTRMNEIIENVLQLARQEPPKPEVLQLRDWLEHFVEELPRHQELGDSRIVMARPDSDLDVVALVDPVQLQQVLWNLCQNALKYGRRDGRAAQVTIRPSLLDGRKGPVIDVIDQGPGVPEEDADRIFQPFYTSSADGTGLGLYLCRQLCALNQGDLEYMRNPDGGSIFRLSLPAAPGAPGDSRRRQQEGQGLQPAG